MESKPSNLGKEKKKLSETLSCVDIFDRLWYCGTPTNQLNRFYRNGEIEYCSTYLNDWMGCMKARLISDETLREVK